ncbi:MAG TPA: trypsin-like peptidase domain-containing protein [Acetobacteraceae bacterium]|jgi:protease YdgD
MSRCRFLGPCAALLAMAFVTAAAGPGQNPVPAPNAFPAIVLPGLGPHDPRRVMDTKAQPWGGVVLLQIPGISRCTASLVAPRLALTAAHCLYGPRLGHFVPPEAVHVLSGYVGGDYARHSIATALRIAPGYNPIRPAATRAADFALVTLAEKLIAPDGALGLDRQPVTTGERLMLGGYSQDRAEILTADTLCHAAGLVMLPGGAIMLRHDCAGTRGTSGAPVLAQGADGRWRIAGLEVAAVTGEAEGLAVPAATLASILPPP